MLDLTAGLLIPTDMVGSELQVCMFAVLNF